MSEERAPYNTVETDPEMVNLTRIVSTVTADVRVKAAKARNEFSQLIKHEIEAAVKFWRPKLQHD